jgi:hypothetical protein
MAKSRKRTTPAKLAPVEPAAPPIQSTDTGPVRQIIAMRAYELFLLRGATHGDDWRDWLTAERELAIGGLSAREPMADAADYAG